MPLHPGSHGKPRGSQYDWGRIEDEFVRTPNLTRNQIAEKFGCSRSSLDQKVSAGGWVQKRETYRRELAEETKKQTAAVIAEKRAESTELIYNLKLVVLQRLQERLQNRDYQPTPSDVAMLQKLEMDLRQPGWMKGVDDDGNVISEQRIEVVVELIQQQRKDALERIERGDVGRVGRGTGLPRDIEGFVYGDSSEN